MDKPTFKVLRKWTTGTLLLAMLATASLPQQAMAAQKAQTNPAGQAPAYAVQLQAGAQAIAAQTDAVHSGGAEAAAGLSGSSGYLQALAKLGYLSEADVAADEAAPITRAEAAVLLQKALRLPAAAAVASFPDLAADDPAAPAVHALVEKGIVQGSGNGFHPGDTLTREQMASLLTRAFALNDNGMQVTYKDNDAIASFHEIDALRLKQHFIWEGQTFNPLQTVSRGEFGKAIYLALGLDTAQPGAIPLEDFFRTSDQLGFQLSPDGKHMAFLKMWNNRLNVFVKPVGSDAEPVRLTSETERNLAGYAWISNDRLIYIKDTAGDENYHIIAIKIDGTGNRDLTPYENTRGMIIDMLPDVPDQILIGMNKRDPRIFDVYRVNLDTAEATLVAENPGNIAGWMTDNEGRLRVALSSDGNVSTVLYREKEDAPFEPLLTTKLGEAFYPMAFTADNKNLYVSSNLESDKAALVEYDPAAKKVVKRIYAHDEVDVSSVLFSRTDKSVSAVSYITDKPHYVFFDSKLEQVYKKLQSQFPGKEIAIGSPDEKGSFRFQAYNDKNMGLDYVYNGETGESEKLAELSDWLDENKLADMKPVTYTARDGLTLHGYLTLPKGKEAKDLPLVVNPHGGPWARDMWGYNPEVQFLASRGYAVLQVNFRGSTGYGKSFLEAGNKEWGKAMQNDLTDGVEWLVGQGIADPDRVAIYGASYGGYAALAGLTFTPDVYAAGVSYVGPSNLFTLMASFPPYWESQIELFYSRVGNPEKDKELLEAVSPLFHVDQIKAPLFVVQGANDPRVKQAESDQIVKALQERNVDVPYMLKENEGHGFHNLENQLDFYRALEKFLNRHLQP